LCRDHEEAEDPARSFHQRVSQLSVAALLRPLSRRGSVRRAEPTRRCFPCRIVACSRDTNAAGFQPSCWPIRPTPSPALLKRGEWRSTLVLRWCLGGELHARGLAIEAKVPAEVAVRRGAPH